MGEMRCQSCRHGQHAECWGLCSCLECFADDKDEAAAKDLPHLWGRLGRALHWLLSPTAALLVALTLACGQSPPPVATPTPTGSASSASADLCGDRCVLNLAVTQDTIRQTICKSGWTKTIRPPVAYTDQLKRQQMAQLGLPGSPSGYEEDHRVPLELGGDPRAAHNLTPEAHPGSSAKDSAENAAKTAVCRATNPVSLAAEQAAFIATWLGPWPKYLK